MIAVSALALAAAVTATSAVVSAGAGVAVWMITVRAGFAVVASLRCPGVKPGRTSTSGPLQACGLKGLSAGAMISACGDRLSDRSRRCRGGGPALTTADSWLGR